MLDVTIAHAAAAPAAEGFRELLLDKAGQYILIISFFAAIIWFLRFMYGPRGVFRDPAWDRWNESARRDDAQRRQAEAEAEHAGGATAVAPPATGQGERP